MSKKAKNVHALLISHRHGTDVNVAKSEKGAMKLLYEYVEEEWHDFMGDAPMPEDRDKAIAAYFEEAGECAGREEFYSIIRTPLYA